MTLQELTGQESGIVVYFGSEPAAAIVCNWSMMNGLPRLGPFGVALLGLGEDIPPVAPETCENVKGYLEGVHIIFANGEHMPIRAQLYNLPELAAAILAPEGWA